MQTDKLNQIEILRNKWKTGERIWSDKEASEPQLSPVPGKTSQYFAYAGLETSVYIRRFTLKLKTGRQVSIPYASLPVIDYLPEGILKILSPGVDIVIKGRNLNLIAQALINDQVIWIKESLTGIDDQMEDLFVAEIRIGGSLVDTLTLGEMSG